METPQNQKPKLFQGLIGSILALTFCLLVAGEAFADKNLGHLTQKEVKGMCGGKGDVFMPANSNGVFGCAKANGDVIGCGGKIKQCTQTRQVPTGNAATPTGPLQSIQGR